MTDGAPVHIGMCYRVLFGRRQNYGCQHGSLGKSQLRHVLSEVALCSLCHTVGAVAEVDEVQVILKDLVLGKHCLELHRQELLLDLTREFVDLIFLTAARENLVL